MRGWRSVIATAGVLAYAAVAPRLARHHAALTAAGVSAVALGAARASGLSWDELGLAPSRARRSAAVGCVAAAPIVTALVAGSRHPAMRRFLADARVVELSTSDAAYEMLVRIPVVTAATEELLFRSVLFGVSEQWLGTRRAVVWTSVVFGVWHVVPALHSHRHNAAAAGAVDGMGGPGALVAGTVAATAGAGLALCALRVRTNSIVAPMIVHAAINGVAFAAARAMVSEPFWRQKPGQGRDTDAKSDWLSRARLAP
jgi:membrane protease YdiL (CAAX protease family)